MTYRDRSSRLHSRVSVVLTAAVLTLAVTSASAQDTTGVGAISGVVVNAAGLRTEGVRVCALDTASCATSDARGVFRIGELRAGAYRLEILPLEEGLKASKPGYRAYITRTPAFFPWFPRVPR